MRNVLGYASFLIVSGRVLLSDVSSPPREVWTPAADDPYRWIHSRKVTSSGVDRAENGGFKLCLK